MIVLFILGAMLLLATSVVFWIISPFVLIFGLVGFVFGIMTFKKGSLKENIYWLLICLLMVFIPLSLWFGRVSFENESYIDSITYCNYEYVGESKYENELNFRDDDGDIISIKLENNDVVEYTDVTTVTKYYEESDARGWVQIIFMTIADDDPWYHITIKGD